MCRQVTYKTTLFCRFRLSLAIVLLSIGIGGQSALSQSIEPAVAQEFIASLGDRAIAILSDTTAPMSNKEKAFHLLVAEAFSMDFIARFAMGKNWRQATPAQQNEYLALFRQYIVQTYGQHIASYSGEQFQVEGSRDVGKQDVLVRSRIVRPGGAPPIIADWRLRQFPEGPRIIDVMIEGISMGVTQRQEFASVISRNGINGLIEILRARSQSLSVSAPQG